MGLSVGTMIIIIVLLGIINPFLQTISVEYSQNVSAEANLSILTYQLTTNYTNKIILPLVGNPSNGTPSGNSTIYKGVGSSNNLNSASNLFGFAFAFIIPGLINVMLNLFYLPQFIAQYVAAIIGFIPILPFQATAFYNQLVGIAWLFMGLLFVSAWLKYPII